MTEKENKGAIQLPKIFDENPELRDRILEKLKDVTPEERKQNLEMVRKFINGEATWAEIKKIPKRMLKELARVAYLKYKQGDLAKAEILFKGLAILDHMNWYYRSALGAVFQKKGEYESAIEEYDIALELNADEVTSRVNRGMCFFRLKDFENALVDFAHVTKLGVDETNPWLKRAKTMSQVILTMQQSG